MGHTENALPNFRQQSDDLYQEALSHPGSDAEEIVRALVLAGVSRMQAGLAGVGWTLAEERRSQHALRQAAEAPALHDAPERSELARGFNVWDEIVERQEKLDAVAKALEDAQKGKASGKSLTDSEIYNRIAAVVGLPVPPPKAVTVEPRQAAEPSGDGEDEQSSEC